MPGVATETHHPVPNGYNCSRFYGSGHFSRYLAPLNAAVAAAHRVNIIGVGAGHDVTDNKTNDQLLPSNDPSSGGGSSIPYQLKPIYTMNDIYHIEDERLKTFDNWPLNWMDKFQLAQTGMFYTGECDKVKCYFCEVEIGRWEREDQPVPEHLRWSPNCPLLRRRTTNNLPISAEALDRILPPVSYDICGSNDAATSASSAIEVRPHAYAEGTIAAGPRTMGVNTAPTCSNYFPEYPEYAIEAARKRSFAEWPRHMKQKPEQLAEAGFFYTGVGDRVKCFSCGGGLKDWDECDEPWEQHALWLSKCRFLKLMRGQQYIDATIAKQKAQEADDEAKLNDGGLLNQASAAKPQMLAAAASTLLPVFADTSNFASSAANLATTTPCDIAPQVERIYDNAIAASTECSASASTAAGEKKSPNAFSSSIPEEKLCKICYAAEYNTAFLPCGHVVACAKCASSVTKCPLCRKPFTDVMRVYFS